jgi:hypothetical protein
MLSFLYFFQEIVLGSLLCILHHSGHWSHISELKRKGLIEYTLKGSNKRNLFFQGSGGKKSEWALLSQDQDDSKVAVPVDSLMEVRCFLVPESSGSQHAGLLVWPFQPLPFPLWAGLIFLCLHLIDTSEYSCATSWKWRIISSCQELQLNYIYKDAYISNILTLYKFWCLGLYALGKYYLVY